jgi:hypothetical protein
MSISLKNKLNKTKIVHSQKITYFNLNCKIQSQVGIRDRLKVREQVCEKLFIDGQRHPVNQVLGLVKTQLKTW